MAGWFRRMFSGKQPPSAAASTPPIPVPPPPGRGGRRGGGGGSGGGGGESDYIGVFKERRAALEKMLGPADDNILTSLIPIYLGGQSDVLRFSRVPDAAGGGIAYVTAGLTETSGQPPSAAASTPPIPVPPSPPGRGGRRAGGGGSGGGSGESDYIRVFNARRGALEAMLGPADDNILTSLIPIYLGGQSDVLRFSRVPDAAGGGIAYVTAGLTQTSAQPPSKIGNYELMIRTRAEEPQAGPLISGLAAYTLRTVLNPNDTMDLGENQPPGVTIRALLALEPDPPMNRFEMFGKSYAILMLVGITTSEMNAFRGGRADETLAALRRSVLPFTDLRRPPVI